MLESQIQAKLIKLYESQGFYTIKLIKTNKNGTPDLLLIKDGTAQFVEVKSATGAISDLQRLRAKELRAKGCQVRFVTEGDRNVDEGTTTTVEDF